MKKQEIVIVSDGTPSSTEVYINGTKVEEIISVDILPITENEESVIADITIRATGVKLGIPSVIKGFASDKFDGSFGK